MKALVKFDKGREGMEIREVPKPELKNNELLVRIMGIGICGTDIHIMNDEYKTFLPVIMGHEYTGIIEDMGKDVNGFSIGDQIVSITPVVYCGECEYCRKDLLLLCGQRRSIGSGVDGAMADYMTIPANTAYKLPKNMCGNDTMVIAEPLACVIRAVIEKSKVKAGDIVLVSGPGTIGLLTLIVAKAQGAFVIVSGMPADNKRLKLAEKLGADITVNNPEELERVVAENTRDGVNVAFECAGAAGSLDTCIKTVKKTGNVAQVGLYGKPITADIDSILCKEIDFTVSYAAERSSWEILLKLVEQDKLKGLNLLISDRLPIEQWEKAFDKVINKEGNKIVLTL